MIILGATGAITAIMAAITAGTVKLSGRKKK